MFSRIKALGLVLALCLALTGCSRLTYVMHAAAGQFRVMASVEPFEELAAKGALTKAQMDKIDLIQRVKRYAEQELGVKKTNNYRRVYPRPMEQALRVVSASPKDTLQLKTWWFPVIGRMPYLGFFSNEKAEGERLKLEKQGYDAVVHDAEAYSTLGWFEDPITMNMLVGSPAVLADTIVHELTHVTVYVKGQSAFNEGLALFMGRLGALQFLQSACGSYHPQTQLARDLVHDERIFSDFLNGLLADLEAFYSSPITYQEKVAYREKVYKRGLERFQKIKPLLKTTLFRTFGQAEVNNAELLSIALYHRYFSLFEAVYVKNNKELKNTLQFFVRLAREPERDLLNTTRDWLRSQNPDS
jgi:predicted aminopeptidase